MKNLILILFTTVTFSQSEVPSKYWINDDDFEDKIAGVSAFGDNNEETIVVEFWAEFNKDNCFDDWNKIEDALYYRVDVAQAPKAKKEYRVRMVPTILIFKNGSVEESFKAGLDLELPTDLTEIQDAVDKINEQSKF
jgi:thiol-disulfide isomerase/thioredoxin|tara:strand:- start:96 stop:506 length:411 start_codon:yes stop_codon:yes gene_type:complete